jgi:hypothetical protein
MKGMSSFGGSGNMQSSAGVNEVFEFDLQPVELTRLRTGGPENKFRVDAILHRTGTPFRSNGRNWMRTTFSQKK